MATRGEPADSDGVVLSRRAARWAGLAYLGLALGGLAGFLLIGPSLYEAGDAAATAANLVDHEGLARLGIAADLFTVLTQALAALAFVVLFHRLGAVTAAALGAFGLVNAVAVLVGTAATATALEVALAGGPTAPANALLLYDLKDAAWQVGGLFFGLWLIPMGRLALTAGFPRGLGWVLIGGGVGYVLSTFAHYLLPDASWLADVLVLPASVGEFWMIGYLLLARRMR